MNIPSNSDRGLLDISVELSSRDITAGKQFALFVLVKNPFDKVVWIRRVHVSLPSELRLATSDKSLQSKAKEFINTRIFKNDKDNLLNNLKKEREKIKIKTKEIEKKYQKINQELSIKINEFSENKIFLNSLNTKLNELEEEFRSNQNKESLNKEIEKISEYLNEYKQTLASQKDDIDSFEKMLENHANIINELHQEIKVIEDQYQERKYINFRAQRSNFNDLMIVGDYASIELGGSGIEEEVNANNVQILSSQSYEEIQAKTGRINLESSLPENSGLQPGSTVVYTAILNVKSALFFSPSKYRLQFNVNYAFEPNSIKNNDQHNDQHNSESLFTNTVSQEISIRPSIASIIFGSAVGGFFGSVCRLLQLSNNSQAIETFSSDLNFIFTIVVVIILSAISIVFMARKSEAQSFISVEDFWGGLLIGFLIGYTGTSFFEEITGFQNPTVD